MIRSLRIRFTLIATLALSIILIAPIALLNLTSQWESGRENTIILQVINENDGTLPVDRIEKILQSSFFGLSFTKTEGLHYQYFSAFQDSEGNISVTNKSNLDYLTDDEITQAASSLISAAITEGTTDIEEQSFSYQIKVTESGTRISAININSQIANRTRLFYLSVILFVLGLLVFTIVAAILSRWAVQPFVENYEKQKRFITNAGHELKTPLAIISANTELQEMIEGENEWSASTKTQVERMTSLINHMVALARLEEQPNMELTDIDFSETVYQAAKSFKSSIVKDGKRFEMNIVPDIHIKAESKSAYELATILVDNANKYCDPQGKVSVELRKSRDIRYTAHLEVANTYAEGKNKDYSQFFERFYRDDESHSSAGFGIGLNMAQNMVKLFKGRIDVRYADDTIVFVVRI
ncbi:sensor histidine kinase [Alloscardovia criceti]|uniref:sensor histidine kinase n=1 Tax=Alloscardovia criceti TaxID=356828 RepID=UPI00037A76B8|nr:HAMP domain-containing sensor histidine kinase [Alloscardovia criceti]